MITTVLAAFWLQGGGQSNAPTFFTVESLFTSAGITTAVVAVTSVLLGLFPNLPAKWFALGLSLILALLDISVHHLGWSGLNVFVAVLNGLMVYAAAVGINTAATSPGGKAHMVAGRSSRWWP